nr:unnamed protein product [Haemonchus contortus]
MLFIFFVLPFVLVNADLDSAVEAAFKQLNKKYNPKIKWSTELEQKALEYLKSPKSVKADMVIEGKKFAFLSDPVIFQRANVIFQGITRRIILPT